jgi:multisubunit Na+/H+ antiporter MnhF subunit
MIKGPTIPDRVIAGDTISSLAIVIIILFAIKYNNMMFIDIAIVISILSFISTIIISKYLLGKEIGEE